jgi:phage terminase large subunit-like protein
VTDEVEKFEKFYAELGHKLERPYQAEIVEEIFSPRRELLVSLARGNGKSTLSAGFGLFRLLRDPAANIVIAAASRDQAAIVFDIARKMALRHPFIASRVKVTRRELRTGTDGILKVVSADADRQLGLIPSLVIVDELASHPNDELYVALRTALGVKDVPGAKMVVISTAGVLGDGPMQVLRERCLAQEHVEREGVFTRCLGEHVAMLEWALPADWPLERAVEANPASWVSAEGLREQREAVHGSAFRRFHANQRVAAGEDAFIDLAVWDALGDESLAFPVEAKAAIGMDGSRTFDTTVVAIAARRPDNTVVVDAHVFSARRDAAHHVLHQGKIDMADVEEFVVDLFSELDVVECAYDPRYLERSAELLEARLPETAIFAVEPSSKLMREALQSFFRVVSEGRLRHTADPVLREHVANTVVDRRDEGDEIRRVRKADGRRPIDATVAMALAVWRVEHPAPVAEIWAATW